MGALRWIGISLLALLFGKFAIGPILVQNRAERIEAAYRSKDHWSYGSNYTPKFVALVECSALMLGAATYSKDASVREPERSAAWSKWQSRSDQTGDALINLALAEAAANKVTRDKLVQIVPLLANKTLNHLQGNSQALGLDRFESFMKSARPTDCLKRSGLVNR